MKVYDILENSEWETLPPSKDPIEEIVYLVRKLAFIIHDFHIKTLRLEINDFGRWHVEQLVRSFLTYAKDLTPSTLHHILFSGLRRNQLRNFRVELAALTKCLVGYRPKYPQIYKLWEETYEPRVNVILNDIEKQKVRFRRLHRADQT